MKHFSLWLLLLSGLAGPAMAQTVLQISATGSATALPDEATASLAVQATARTAKAAQAAVNQAMANALAQARGISMLAATTNGYSVQDSSAKQNGSQYQATQNLELVMPAPGGVPPAAFAALLGKLQAQNLLLQSLDADLSAAGRASAQNAAITDGVHRMRDQAATVAAALGQQAGEVKTLSVNIDNAAPVMPLRMMAMQAAAAPPPQSAPGPITVTATLNAQIALAVSPR